MLSFLAAGLEQEGDLPIPPGILPGQHPRLQHHSGLEWVPLWSHGGPGTANPLPTHLPTTVDATMNHHHNRAPSENRELNPPRRPSMHLLCVIKVAARVPFAHRV